ncbi:MAG: DNA-protecting protein DprA [Acidimicrobiia bacterium]|nr:DNA-protecting protein DprA [Acidimicrobiia bacterium]
MNEKHGWRLQLAFAGLHPDTVRGLLDAHGAQGAVTRVIKTGNDRAKAASAVPAARRLEELKALETECVFRGEPGYPSRLAELPGAPDLLFVRGIIPALPTVAVVGTRRCSSYGRNLAEAYGAAIARAEWCLVSGLARGIDGAAHRGTVAGGGGGVAVLGCGLDIAYPREHGALADRLVASGGAVISEYPPGTPPEAWRFPPRNRIISGMSRAVVVVEAAIKGGALITANTALDQGVPVFATPGDVGKESAAGCNRLIRDGAQPVLDPADLIAELELIVGPARHATSARDDYPWQGFSIDEMAAARKLSPTEAAAALAKAEIAGAVVRHGDRYYPSTGVHQM